MIEKEDVVILTAVQLNIFVKGRFTLQDHRSLQRIGINFEEFFDEEKISKGQVSSEDFFHKFPLLFLS